jgi:hypothetical protein
MANVTGTFDSLKGHNDALIRKMLELAIFVAPWPAAPTLATISDSSGAQLVIPDTYLSLGMTSKDDGATWTPAIDISEVGAYGYGTAVRRDATSRTLNLAFTMLESKKKTWELYYGLDLASTVIPAAKTELFFDMPSAAHANYYRVLAIGKDGSGTSAIYHGEYLPKAILTDADAVSWTDDSPVAYGVTLSADVDSTYGTSQRSFWCGPGFTSSVFTAMGFTQAP